MTYGWSDILLSKHRTRLNLNILKKRDYILSILLYLFYVMTYDLLSGVILFFFCFC